MTTHNVLGDCLEKYKYNLTYPSGLGSLYVTCVQNCKQPSKEAKINLDYNNNNKSKPPEVNTSAGGTLDTATLVDNTAEGNNENSLPKFIEFTFEPKKMSQSMIVVLDRGLPSSPSLEIENEIVIEKGNPNSSLPSGEIVPIEQRQGQPQPWPKITKLKLDQLRDMCKLNGLSTVGTKEALYNRYYLGKD